MNNNLKQLVDRTTVAFQHHFHNPPFALFQAPGRVNLIGEHTDYNDGFVLPCAINYYTVVAASPRSDDKICVVAVDFDEQVSEFSLNQPIEADPNAPWSNYVRGVVWALQQRDYALGGANLVISGNIPKGTGLSSSAALEVVTGTTLTRLSDLQVDGATIALNGQQAENDFVGMQCGIMDQFISALGAEQHALLIDCRSLESTPIPLPSGLAVLIINSHVQRGLVDSEYNTRRAQCEAVAQHFGVSALRDVSWPQLKAEQSRLDDVAFRRARHVITENERTLQMAQILPTGDLTALGELMADSHISMRDDFEITVPPTDTLVEIVQNVIGSQGGVRQTGGGFGGCVVALVPHEQVGEVSSTIEREYPARTGLPTTIYRSQAVEGAGLINR